MENKGTAVSRDLIMTRLWETDSFVDDNTPDRQCDTASQKAGGGRAVRLYCDQKGIGYMVEA